LLKGSMSLAEAGQHYRKNGSSICKQHWTLCILSISAFPQQRSPWNHVCKHQGSPVLQGPDWQGKANAESRCSRFMYTCYTHKVMLATF
jgi:hypothetical protein